MENVTDPEHSASAPASGTADCVDIRQEDFATEVIEASMTRPVIVDFWAPWCGPCKQLTPLLEKLTKKAAGAVKLVKINVDDNQALAAQLRIQSIPTIYAFKDGQGVDGFQGALPESQLTAFFERLIGEIGPSPSEALVEEALAALEAGDVEGAAARFVAALEADPSNIKALAGLARAHVQMEDLEGARSLLEQVPPDMAADPDLAAVRAALELAESADMAGTDLAPLRAAVAENPKDLGAALDLAEALLAAHENEEAVDLLLEMIRKDREWNDAAARKKLLTVFEALGPTHELTLSGRRRLSSLLFA